MSFGRERTTESRLPKAITACQNQSEKTHRKYKKTKGRCGLWSLNTASNSQAKRFTLNRPSVLSRFRDFLRRIKNTTPTLQHPPPTHQPTHDSQQFYPLLCSVVTALKKEQLSFHNHGRRRPGMPQKPTPLLHRVPPLSHPHDPRRVATIVIFTVFGRS